MPKNWQNLKNITHSLTDSSTWIQEMLLHLKRSLERGTCIGIYYIALLTWNIVDWILNWKWIAKRLEWWLDRCKTNLGKKGRQEYWSLLKKFNGITWNRPPRFFLGQEMSDNGQRLRTNDQPINQIISVLSIPRVLLFLQTTRDGKDDKGRFSSRERNLMPFKTFQHLAEYQYIIHEK